MTRLRVLLFGVAMLPGPSALADRYEATITARPSGVFARLDETGADSPALVGGGGFAMGLTWGVRNWLDVGGEVAAVSLLEARYERATADVFGVPQTGELSRRSQLAQLRAVATLRLGVGWVPTIQLALGAGGRYRSAARLTLMQGATVTPDDDERGITLDVTGGLRVGLDHRVNRRWAIGLSTGATAYVGIGAPDLQAFDASLSLNYTWYPLW